MAINGDMHKSKKVKVHLLNVRGGPRRCVVCIDDLMDCDVLIFNETWLTAEGAEFESLTEFGFSRHFFVCRADTSLHGGVSVYIRDGLKSSLLESRVAPELMALSLGDGDTLLIAGYASPVSSGNRDVDVFEELSIFMTALPEHEHIIILGDFNARIGSLQVTSAKVNMLDPLNLHPSDDEEAGDMFVRTRTSEDKRVCSRGRQCIQFCVNHDMVILNGCAPGDEVGKYTYHCTSGEGSSTIDLGIVSEKTFDKVLSFKVVNSFDVTDHELIAMNVIIDNAWETSTETSRNHKGRPKCVWRQDKWPQYGHKVKGVIDRLKEGMGEIENMNSAELDAKCRWLSRKLCGCSYSAFGGPFAERDEVPDFWDEECSIMKETVRKERKRCLDEGIRWDVDLRKVTNGLKSLVRRKRREAFTRRDIENARLLRRDPKSFWGRVDVSQKSSCVLEDCEGAVKYFEDLLNAPSPEIDWEVLRSYDIPSKGGDSVQWEANILDGAIRESEVCEALKRLANGKSTSDGVKIELFKYARVKDPTTKVWTFLSTTLLARIFTRVFLGELDIPESWKNAFLVPVYKGKGDKHLLDSYRGISILSSLYKLYSAILGYRVDQFCTSLDLRAISQCGFRNQLGTTSAFFTLNHLLHATCTSENKGGLNRPLFICFVDFKKAFDSVWRSLIWHRLQTLGIKGHMLHAIQALYQDTKFRVRINGKTSQGFVVTVSGVKQGCPLSPVLFGLFIEQLCSFLEARCPDIKVLVLDEHKLRDILYADDVALMTISASELQELCNALFAFCGSYHMEVNKKKSEVVVFHPYSIRSTAHREAWYRSVPGITYSGTSLVRKDSFRYLGLWVHESSWFYKAPGQLTEAASKAMWTLVKKIQGRRIFCINVKLTLFKSLIATIGNYGCQVWGVNYLRFDSEKHIFENPFQKVVLLFLRVIGGAFQSTSRWVLLKEFGFMPTQVFLARLCIRFWNKNTTTCAPILMRKMFLNDIKLFQNGSDTCWTAKLLVFLLRLDLIPHGLSYIRSHLAPEDIMTLKFSEMEVVDKLEAKYKAFGPDLSLDPRTAPSKGLHLVRHHQWFEDKQSPHLYFSAPEHHLKTLFKFRLGCTKLRVHDHSIDRSNRICLLCGTGGVEDELHVLFECPSYNAFRLRPPWNSLFQNIVHGDVRAFMNQKCQCKVASFIHFILQYRLERLERRDRLVSQPGLEMFSSGEDD